MTHNALVGLLIHQTFDSLLALLAQHVEEDEEKEHAYYGKFFIYLRAHEDAVENAMGKYGGS